MTGKRANETTGLRDYETTGRRDYETARPAEKTQAFSGILSRSQLRAAVRGSLVSEWCSSVADKEIGLDG